MSDPATSSGPAPASAPQADPVTPAPGLQPPQPAHPALAAIAAGYTPKLDPAGYQHLLTLAERLESATGPLRHILTHKLETALSTYQTAQAERLNAIQAQLAQLAARHPAEAPALQALLDAGDYPALRRAAIQLATPASPLAELVRQLAAPEPSASTTPAAPLPELKAVRRNRQTWTRLNADRQVTQAFTQAPENAGPLNSHMLVLRCLALLRDIGPDYLNHFVSYVETLQELEPEEKVAEKPATVKKKRVGKK